MTNDKALTRHHHQQSQTKVSEHKIYAAMLIKTNEDNWLSRATVERFIPVWSTLICPELP